MPSNEHEQRLITIVRASPAAMGLLEAARSLNLDSWCIGAGVIRSLVWDHLHGFRGQSHVEDVDVVYYDDSIDGPKETALAARLTESFPSVRWEVTNQALIHKWFLEAHSQVVPPLRSLADGIATWPEYATCVGVRLGADDAIEVIAPHGLEDLFGLKIRHNPSRASAAVFAERVASKRFTERWPMVSLVLN